VNRPGAVHLVVQLADEMRSISRHLAAAARLASQTAVVLAAKARAQVATVNDDASLRAVATMTRIANEAAETGLALLRSNEHALSEVEAERRRDAQRVTRIEIVPMQPRESHPSTL
jgi:hypothetical protein